MTDFGNLWEAQSVFIVSLLLKKEVADVSYINGIKLKEEK